MRSGTSPSRSIAVALTLAVATAVAAYAAPGDLDPSFGTGGVVTIPASSIEVTAVALQGDGKILVAGWMPFQINDPKDVVVRLLPDGTLDSSFGTGGFAISDPGTTQPAVIGVAVSGDGSILVLDYHSVARFDASGTLDLTFGTAGYATFSGNVAGTEAHSITIQPDGKMLIGGYTPTFELGVARLQPDGTPDAGFGTGGVATTGAPGGAFRVALQADGSILVAGWSPNPSDPSVNACTVARFDSAGALDATFGTGGVAVVPMHRRRSNGAGSVALQSDGKVLLAGGITKQGTLTKFFMARLLADGTLDPTFHHTGRVTKSRLEFFSFIDEQTDGKVLAAGVSTKGRTPDLHGIGIVRLTSLGGNDPTFGRGGIVRRPGEGIVAAVLQPDDRLVAGSVEFPSGTEIRRYLP